MKMLNLQVGVLAILLSLGSTAAFADPTPPAGTASISYQSNAGGYWIIYYDSHGSEIGRIFMHTGSVGSKFAGL